MWSKPSSNDAMWFLLFHAIIGNFADRFIMQISIFFPSENN